MIIPLRIWWRRASALRALPVLVTTQIAVMFARSGWDHEWMWAMGTTTLGCVLLAPLAAGLVAFDRARQVEPTMAQLTRAARRGMATDLALLAVTWFYVTCAWAVGMALALWLARRGGASGPIDVWMLPEGPVLLLVGCAAGLAAGSRWHGVLVAPVAACGVFLARLLVDVMQVGQFLSTVMVTGSLAGYERNPVSVLAVVVAHLATVALLMGIAWGHGTGAWLPWRRRGAVLMPLAVLCVAGVGGLVVSNRTVAEFRASGSSQVCETSGDVTVCGPEESRYGVTLAAAGLDEAVESLAASGISWRTSYALVRPGRFDADTGVLTVNVENADAGGISPEDVVTTLSQPRLCAAYYDDLPPEDLMEAQEVVQEWLWAELYDGPRSGTAPAAVSAAYTTLARCEPWTRDAG